MTSTAAGCLIEPCRTPDETNARSTAGSASVPAISILAACRLDGGCRIAAMHQRYLQYPAARLCGAIQSTFIRFQDCQ